MKHLKTLGLAAVAVAALMATAGAGSASATVFCKENATPCPAEKRWAVNTEFKSSLEAGQAVIKAGLAEIKCGKSNVNGSISNAGAEGAPVILKLEQFSFEECGCPVTTLKPGSMSAAWTNGTMNAGLTIANTQVTFNCMGHCIYGEGPLGALTGGAMATMDVDATLNKVAGGAFCPATATLEADYTVTAPEPLYVAEK
ncbi:MAG TPA: hypothetical protein VFY48_02160 [Solirubrobacterales bacterium]|nr:hypothetical protein [Solirubrobacterales bacterium]